MVLFILFCVGAVIAFFSIKKSYDGEDRFVVRGGIVLGIGLMMYVVSHLMVTTLTN